MLNNRAVLLNAVEFTTARRAFEAQITVDMLEGATPSTIEFLSVRAFSEFVTSTEDALGWVWVLKEWDPNDDYSLYKLLDKTDVNPSVENKIAAHLKGLDANGGRKLFHVPTDDELLASGVPAETVDLVAESIPKKVEGFRKVHEFRTKMGRNMVKGFNKTKHMNLVFPVDRPSGRAILMPKGQVKSASDQGSESIRIDGVEIVPSVDYIKQRAQRTLESQAIVWDTLALILQIRFHTPTTTPDWLETAFQNWDT